MMQMPKCSKFLRCFFVSLHLPYFWFIEFQSPLCIFASDMKFVQNFTPPDFQAKNFTPSISPNLNSFSKKKHKKWVKMKKFTPLARNFTLPPGLTGWTNFTSALHFHSKVPLALHNIWSPTASSCVQVTFCIFAPITQQELLQKTTDRWC